MDDFSKDIIKKAALLWQSALINSTNSSLSQNEQDLPRIESETDLIKRFMKGKNHNVKF